MMKKRSPFSIFAGFTLAVLGGMIFNLGGIFAGRSALLLKDLEIYLSWVFLIYPLLLTVRGDIEGILSGKLGTAIHLGSIKPTWKKNNSRFYELSGLVFFLSVYDGFIVSISATVISMFLGLSANFFQILIISITTFSLTATISMILTYTLTFWIFNRKGDPDVYVYPIMSAVNDILITIMFFSICILYRPWNSNLYLFLGIPVLVVIAGIIVFYFIRFGSVDYVKSSLKQALPIITLTTLIASGTGTILASLHELIEEFPVFLIIYPAMISTVGGQGSILANTTTTKLHLGTIKPAFSFLKSSEFISPFGGILLVGIMLNLIYSVVGTLISPEGISLYLYGIILTILLLSNIMGFLVIGMLASFAAFITFRIGLDPDNFVNPILSSGSDLITTALLSLSFIIFF
ncbi:MAG: magnesium transporter [Candidatus Heimdallarchaeota archaeon]|nr:magnesium transporter [Candidatus Heimdallarchaeota archaeon]